MRDFAFRAWDKLNGMEYFEFDDLKYGRVNITHGVYDVPVMQCTGLKDSTGKKVYESDICEGENAIYVIQWDSRKGQYAAKIITTKSVLTKNLTFPLWQYVEDDGLCRFKVIGNVYENKEYIA